MCACMPACTLLLYKRAVYGARGFGVCYGAGIEFWFGSRATLALHLEARGATG